MALATRTARGLTRDPQMVDDISQDATIRVLTGLHKYNPRWKFSTWTRVVTRNIFIDWFRRQRRRSFSEVPDIACPAMLPDATVAALQDQRRVRAAVEDLPPIYKQVIEMHHFQHLKYSEIADRLDLPMGTVMNRIFRARKKLHALMAPMAA
jgi:RNA polymerase sigma-70 factor (ECF subfamily)